MSASEASREVDGLLRDSRRAARGFRGRHQEGLSQARDGLPPRSQQEPRYRGALQAAHRGVRGAAGSGQAGGLRPLRRGRPTEGGGGGGGGRRGGGRLSAI